MNPICVAVGHDSDLVLTSFWTSFFPPVDITQTLWQMVAVANGTLNSVVKPELAGEVYAGKSLQLTFTWGGNILQESCRLQSLPVFP